MTTTTAAQTTVVVTETVVITEAPVVIEVEPTVVVEVEPVVIEEVMVKPPEDNNVVVEVVTPDLGGITVDVDVVSEINAAAASQAAILYRLYIYCIDYSV